MSLQKKIRDDLKSETSVDKRNALRVIVGEFQRQKTKILADIEVVKILKTLCTQAEETKKLCHEDMPEQIVYIRTLKSYIPEEVSKEEIINWVKSNVDFTKLKHKNMAIGIVTREFGARVDGTKVKHIIEEMQ